MDSINSIQARHKRFQFVSPSSSSFSALQLVLDMARNGVVSWRKRFGKTESGCCDSSPSSDSDEVHVLAVDDSLIDRTVIERLLKISSCKVTAVDSGRRALQYLGLDDETSSSDDYDGLKVDMIITDYCMPGMTGFELLKKVKESSALREIPVIIMSSENILARIDRCLEEGAEDYIVKPVKLSDVVRLRDYMKRDSVDEHSSNGDHKRKVRDFTDVESSSPSISSFSPSESSSSCSSSSVPSSPPTSLDSPIGRLKMSTTTTID